MSASDSEPEVTTVVWVLGAGFSRALGAPLLCDLFCEKRWPRVRTCIELANVSPDVVNRIKTLHVWFARCWVSSETFGTRVDKSLNETDYLPTEPVLDAEVFLERLALLADYEAHDAGRKGPWPGATRAELDALAKRISGGALALQPIDSDPALGGESFREYAAAARIYIAAAVNECVPEPAVVRSSERWRPYIAWALGLLRGSGTAETSRRAIKHQIISFNYDTVVEHAVISDRNNQNGLDCKRGHEEFTLRLVDEENNKEFLLYKVHGSVASYEVQGPEGSIKRGSTPPECWKLNLSNPLILCPGDKCREQGALSGLWLDALGSLRCAANHIIFVGYRFPPSDSGACLDMLGAIRENITKRGTPGRLRTIRTVLGPDTAAPDVRRMQALLGHTLRRSGCSPTGEPGVFGRDAPVRLIAEPLYAEDFISVYSDAMLDDTY